MTKKYTTFTSELSGLGIHIKPFNDSFFKDLICTTTASISSGETPDLVGSWSILTRKCQGVLAFYWSNSIQQNQTNCAKL
jgi:hypothetical protein